jgi:hypothetical protein
MQRIEGFYLESRIPLSPRPSLLYSAAEVLRLRKEGASYACEERIRGKHFPGTHRLSASLQRHAALLEPSIDDMESHAAINAEAYMYKAGISTGIMIGTPLYSFEPIG